MAKFHVLTASGGPDTYLVVVHAPAPVGNNAAGVAWSDAIKNSGRGMTMMTVGTGPGQISNTEANQIAAGTVIEDSFAWQDDPAWTNPERIAYVDTMAVQLMAELTARLQRDLKYFGYTRT
jgi:hypothetical protein